MEPPSHARKVFAVAVLVALALAVAPVTEAQAPIRIGASLAQTGVYAAPGQNQLRGYQLCVKHMNDKGGVLGRKLELVLYDDQILVEAIRRAGSLDSGKLRDVILMMDHNTVFGGFRVDRDGAQIGHKMLMFQWQDGKKVIVWPEELAPGRARFPTPPWSQRP